MDRVLGHACFRMNDSRGRLDCAQMQNSVLLSLVNSLDQYRFFCCFFSILTGITKLSMYDDSRHRIRAGKWVRGGADKSLARPNSRCRRTESLVSLERGVCSYVELQVFSCYRGWKEACQATRAITTWRLELSSSFYFLFFFFLQDKAPKEINAILTETLREHAPSYATVKNWVAQFKRGDFSTYVAPRPGRPQTVTIQEIIDQNNELILENRRISAKIKLGISRELVGFTIHEGLNMRKLSAK